MFGKLYRRISQRNNSTRCEYDSVDECPYNSENECNFDKRHCHLVEQKKNKKKMSRFLLYIILCILVGLLFYVIITVLSLAPSFQFNYSNYFYSIISGISISIVTGAVLAIVIDVPSRLRDYEDSFVNALTSNNYLKGLDENRLTKLRNDITEQLHKANAPCMARGLIKIDQRVCELLRQPYYSRYRHTVKCTLLENSDFVEKEHSIDYKLINPYSVNRDAVEYIRFSNLILTNGNEDEKCKAFRDLKITCRKDDEKEIDYSDKIELKYKSINKDTEFYDTKVILDSKDNSHQDINGIRVAFKNNICVHIQYKVKVHKDDICFTKRLQHPAKNFRLDYTYNNPSVKLYGQIFGTEIKQSDISIKYINQNALSLETFDWLLPDNGAIVVMLNK